MPKRRFAISFLTVIAVGTASAQDPYYRRDSSQIYDEARIVDLKNFSMPSVLSLARDFINGECVNRKLARLLVAPTKGDLRKATNFFGVFDSLPGVAERALPNPSFLGQDVGQLQVAKILCFSGNATVILRNGDALEEHQLTGSQSSWKWSVRGTAVTLVGFNLRGDSGRVWLSAFVRVKSLPGLTVAAAIRADIEERAGVPTYLTLRTDPFFWNVEGPRLDPFEVPAPKISGKEFAARPYISCPPSDNDKACTVERYH